MSNLLNLRLTRPRLLLPAVLVVIAGLLASAASGLSVAAATVRPEADHRVGAWRLG
jgi:hypothetical protein